MASSEDSLVHVASVADVREAGPTVVTVDGRSVGLFYEDGTVHALDNRCPHMGFPLHRGTVDDGVLTCHWHHARFELDCGDTFDLWADDVPTHRVEVRDGEVWIDPEPSMADPPATHWRNRLRDGLQEDLRLVIAKAVIGLDDADVPAAVPLEIGAEFGTAFRRVGWGPGLTILTAMANILDALRPADRRRALFIGLDRVADDCAGEPPRFEREPFDARDVSADRLVRWFRDTVEVRDGTGAERVLRTAIAGGHDESALARLVLAAGTDHRYLDSGHRLDFANKAFELLDHIGWDHAETILPSLVTGLADADRAEESSSWRRPVDLISLVEAAVEALPDRVPTDAAWTPPTAFQDHLLADDPHTVIDAVSEAVAAGATPVDLADEVAQAAATRVAQFSTGNEFSDWNTVHHTYTYANAVCGLVRRTDAPAGYRAVYDGAVNLYLDRFLNTPPAPIPEPATPDTDTETILEDLGAAFETEGEVATAGRKAAAFLDGGGDPARLKRALGRATLREDAGFHVLQNLEAAIRGFDRSAEPDRGRMHLVATARYLAAHTPTRREAEQTFRIAERLNRGERIHED